MRQILASILLLLLAEVSEAQEYHTSPYCWASPRTYASGETERVDVAVLRSEKNHDIDGTLSPNAAYEFEFSGRINDSDTDWHPRLLIRNERPYILEFKFPNTTAISEAEWINENLIYIRLWWGRVAGSDFIVDVEKEVIIYQQSIRYGAVAFQQYKQCADADWQDEEQCQCVDGDSDADAGLTGRKSLGN